MKINKKNIKKILFLISLVTILLLIIILVKQEESIITCQEINEGDVGKRIILKGNIINEKISSERELIYLENCTIPIVLFPKRILIIEKSKELIILGSIEKYNSKLQIIAEKIYY